MRVWETIEASMSEVTKRMKVPGGWIVLNRYRFGEGWIQSMHFVADERHRWKIK